jgi:hypothetical protein
MCKILGSQKFEDRLSSAKSQLKKAEKLSGTNCPSIEKIFSLIFVLGRVVSQIHPSQWKKCHTFREKGDTLSPIGKNHVRKSVHLSPYCG